MLEGEQARQAIDEQSREQAGRRSMEDRPGFEEISPQVGELDEGAFDDFMAEHPDAAMTLLADLTGAVDPTLKALARRLAGRVFVDVARSGRARSRGVGRPRSRPASRAEGDLDLEGSMDALIDRRVSGRRPDADDLRVVELSKPSTAICLVVDRSGSMGGERLATAAVGAAACSWRAPQDHSVLVFSDRVLALRSQNDVRDAAEVTADLLRLRGHGTTDLDQALRAAAVQLSRSTAKRRLTILLSDCRSNAGPDPVGAARRLDELLILAPADDLDDATTFARDSGARVAPVAGPSSIPAALAALLD